MKIMLYFRFAERCGFVAKEMFFFNHLTSDLKSNFHSSILPIVPGSTVVVENVRLEIIQIVGSIKMVSRCIGSSIGT